MCNGHRLCKPRHFIEGRPQGFQNFTINLTGALDEIECKFWETFRNVGCEVPLPHSTGNFQRFPQFQEFRLGYTLSEMNDPLTAYVVNDQRSCMLRKSLQGLTDCVVNVY